VPFLDQRYRQAFTGRRNFTTVLSLSPSFLMRADSRQSNAAESVLGGVVSGQVFRLV
jgi:hypothetical protein